jgi:thiosulfate dehydrogenase [quinone] large subunit
MDTVFGILTVEEWLAFLRIAVGLWWLESVRHKPLRKFVSGQMVNWVSDLADNHPVSAYGTLIKRTVVPAASWFPYLNLAGELAVGIGLVFGIFTPLAALVAIFLNLNYLALAGVRPTKDINVNRCYQCEQGQNLMMISSEIVIFATGAWAVWSLDSLLGLF